MTGLSTKSKLTIATLLNRVILGGRAILGKPDQGVFTRNSIRYSLDLREGIDFAVYLSRYERDLTKALERLLPSGGIAVDAGANVGIHTLAMTQVVGAKGKVFAFEPTCFAVEKLRNSLALNPSLQGSVEVLHAFLAPEPGFEPPQEIFSSWPLGASDDVHPSHGGSLKETTGAVSIHLDSFLRERGVERLDLIKLDVDGHELDVLKGASESIDRFRPSVVVELCTEVAIEHGHTVSDILEFFLNRYTAPIL